MGASTSQVQNGISAAKSASQSFGNQPSDVRNWTGQLTTNSATSGQPQAGMPNQYSNTVGQWDNQTINPNGQGTAKGKGA